MSEWDFRSVWSGRIDHEDQAELTQRLHQCIQPYVAEAAPGIALMGFASDEGVRRNQGRIGASQAPQALRRLCAGLPWYGLPPVYEWGDVSCKDGQLEAAQQALAAHVTAALAAGHLPVVLGGGHEVAWGSWQGLAAYSAQQQAQPNIGIINFDAHFDLRADAQGASSGTPFYQIAQDCAGRAWPFRYSCFGVSATANTAALFQRADQLKVCYRHDYELTLLHLEAAREQLSQFIAACDALYLTIDLDVLPAWVAPGVSAPAAYGVGLEVLEPLLTLVSTSGKLKLVDFAEYNPLFDQDARTARVAARLFQGIVRGFHYAK